MTITKEDADLLERLIANHDDHDLVSDCTGAVGEVLAGNDIKIAVNDECAKLTAAIYRFILSCRQAS